MSHSIALIGAGWYGCHLAVTFRSLGFKVTLFEKNSQIFQGASGNNQFRLHMGFHYARHHGTRLQSRDGFYRFIERYPHLTRSVERNIYAIPKKQSLLDYNTYKMIMQSSGMTFSELLDIPDDLQEVEGAFLTPERTLLISAARAYFQNQLTDTLRLDTTVTSIEDLPDGIRVEGEKFDFLVDTTWGHFIRPSVPCIWEPTILLYYESKTPVSSAYTFVDGPLYSVYPTEDPMVVTLSSVPHTPLGAYESSAQSKAALNRVNSALVASRRASMEQQCTRNLPWFTDAFRFLGVQLSIKTKPIGASDDRSCHVERHGRQLIVFSGKIDAIFHAEERILSAITAVSAKEPEPHSSSLRESIIQLKR